MYFSDAGASSVIAMAAGTTENPAFMMISGASSTQDLCLVAENGLWQDIVEVAVRSWVTIRCRQVYSECDWASDQSWVRVCNKTL